MIQKKYTRGGLAKEGILKQDNLAYLKPMEYQNTYAVAVPRAIAEKYGLKTISDLKKVEGQLKAGFTLEFNDREDGNRGLQKVYGLNLNVATMEPSLRYQAIQSGGHSNHRRLFYGCRNHAL